MPELKETTHLKDLWNDARARELAADQLGLLRYRSNLLGADLRITNFGGGNTSSKVALPDPFTGKIIPVLAVKGSGGDLGSIKESGFALLQLDRLEQLKQLYRGTVVIGSTMFPRDRVIRSLQRYGIGFSESESTDGLRAKLAEFYAQRSLTKQSILPQDCANAIVWLASDQSAKSTGHVIPVDGGLSEAFLR
jgi:hypothetical protein